MPEARPETTVASAGRPQLPAELEEALIALLAEALVAELMESHKAVETLPTPHATGTSPPGHARAVGTSVSPTT